MVRTKFWGLAGFCAALFALSMHCVFAAENQSKDEQGI